MESKLHELKARLAEIHDLQMARAVLFWDQMTYMPPGGSAARARQAATLSRLAHEKFIDPAIGRLLDELQPLAESLPPDSHDGSLLRVVRRDYEKAVRVPASFAAEFSNHTSLTYDVWTQARPADDFAAVRPYLEKTLDLSRQYANFFPGYEHIADPLIDSGDEGMKASTLQALFGKLREQLVPLVRDIAARPPIDDSCLYLHYPAAAQLAFSADVARRFGYDFTRGRQDESPHPFTTNFSVHDVRITTRVEENDVTESLFGFLHEGGHALYEQGIDPELDSTPLAGGTSSGVHESQSRLWENVVGRSRSFWAFFYPRLQEIFAQLQPVPLETFYAAINKVQPSLIRTEADEVTYNLHVMIRFELEMELLEGKLAVRDLPETWRERYQQYLGVSSSDDRNGVLQDVHWYSGAIGGGFQGYTLGNVLSAQFFEAALHAHPEIDAEMREGRFETLLHWLQHNIYRHGRKYTTDELVERVTGGPIRIEPYMRYLRDKYGELYKL